MNQAKNQAPVRRAQHTVIRKGDEMQQYIFSTKGYSAALEYATIELENAGWKKAPNAPIVLLPVPSFTANGQIKGGGSIEELSNAQTILGGNLNHPALKKYNCIDLLKNPMYLSENAAITAHCALCIVMENLPVTLEGCPILVAGWGRIGKCLVRLLRQLGAKPTIAARSVADRALAEALGYQAMDINENAPDLSIYRVIVNTIPAMVFPADKLRTCRENCLKIDLASEQGIEASDVIWARGLPNLDAPESSGKLIAKIIQKELKS